MENRTHIGLDVHKDTTAVAVLRPGTIEPDHRVVPTRPEAYRKLVKGLHDKDVVFCYEAGPCGFTPTGPSRPSGPTATSSARPSSRADRGGR